LTRGSIRAPSARYVILNSFQDPYRGEEKMDAETSSA